MNKIFFCTRLVMVTSLTCTQNATCDLVSYTPPAGWNKEVKANHLTYVIIDSKKGVSCHITKLFTWSLTGILRRKKI